MEELEKKLKEIRKELWPFDVIAYISLGIMIIGIIFIIIDTVTKYQMNSLFYVGIGLMSAIIVINLTNVLVNRKKIDEYYKIKKQIKQKK